MKKIATKQESIETILDNENGTYSAVTITLNFRRRTLFFSFNFVLPTLIISVCSIFGFILPATSGEKIGLRNIIIIIHYKFIYNIYIQLY